MIGSPLLHPGYDDEPHAERASSCNKAFHRDNMFHGAATFRSRANKRTKGAECSRCPNPPAPGQRYCRACHAAYMRIYRAGQSARIKELERRAEKGNNDGTRNG